MRQHSDACLLAFACLSAALFGLTTYVEQTSAACAGSPSEKLHLRYESADTDSEDVDTQKLSELHCSIRRTYELPMAELSCYVDPSAIDSEAVVSADLHLMK